ncbi:MAG: hypothetical protein ABSE54_03325 [Smithella sp.]|jgi:hypothetical protein
MSKKKTYINCVLFDSSSNPCPNRNNKYITIARNWFIQSDMKNLGNPAILNGQDAQLADEVCSNCESFEPYLK